MTVTGAFQDLRVAARALLRRPGFTAIAVVTLALGIGANTAVFTLVDGVLLRPLPFDESERLVSLEHLGRDGQDELPMSTGLYELYQDQVSSLESIALQAGTVINLVVSGDPERIQAQVVTPGFFETLRVEPVLGRSFTEEEGRPGAEPVAVLSDGLWKSHFGGDPNIIGQTADMSGTMRRIVGVMPPEFGHPDRTSARLWIPFAIDPTAAPLAAFGASGIGRLAPESSIISLTTELQGLITRLPEIFPEDGAAGFLQEVNLRAQVRPLKEAVVGSATSTLWILLGTVAFVLLIACANVANLLLVRAEGRQRELALRLALGAGRWEVLRTFMSESFLLAIAGGLAGVGFAVLAVKTSIGLIPVTLPRVAEIGVDLRVLGFTMALATGCAVFFGLFPLIRYGILDLASQLREGGTGSSGSRERHRVRNGLVVLQMALALVLLVGAGLMFKSFQAMRSMDPGFDRENVLTARVNLPSAEIQTMGEVEGLYLQLRDRLAAQPGVTDVGFGSRAPLNGGLSYTSLEVEDHPRSPDELPVFSSNMQAGVGFLEALGVDVLEGRTFRPGDGAAGERSVVVSRSFADEWWPDVSAIGRRLRAGFEGEDWYQIVGVVDDVHYESVEQDAEQMVYYPLTFGLPEEPQTSRSMDVVIKTNGEATSFVPVLRRELRALNSRIPLANPQSLEQVFAASTSRASFTMALLGAASTIALLLGLVGIYGVISYVVSQRRREIGVRMALGATAGSVRGMVVRQGLVLAAGGALLGLVAARLLSSLMTSILYGVSPTDPMTYALVAGSLVAVSVLASWIPARRAAGTQPSLALRSE